MNHDHTIIVGGTRGIGLAMTRAFAQEGHCVSVISRKLPANHGDQIDGVEYWSADVLDQDRLTLVLEEIIQKNGPITSLALSQRFRGEDEDWTGQIETGLTATKSVIEALADKFDPNKDKSIAIISSVASHFVTTEQSVGYHVAKAGLDQMVRYYAVSLGPQGIRVNCVSPGTILKDESKHFFLENEDRHQFYKNINPLGRIGTSDDIANIVVFLCSAKASLITGQNIVVDGGLTLQWYETLARQLAPPIKSD